MTETKTWAILVPALVTAVLVGWVVVGPEHPPDATVPSFQPIAAESAGDVISSRQWNGTTESGQSIAGRFAEYETTDRAGNSRVVSGTFFIPRSSPPPGGWPVIALGHGSTGLQNECAPSNSSTLSGWLAVVDQFLRQGLAVTVANFPGLAAEGVHPYLDSHAAGASVIDSVRAMAEVYPGTSTRWVAYGSSQGGGAIWAANELARTYAPELELLGVVAKAPAADKTDLVRKAADRRLTTEQRGVLTWIEESLSHQYATFDLDQYRTADLRSAWEDLRGCRDLVQRRKILESLAPDDFMPTSQEAYNRLFSILDALALPDVRTTAPMLVIYGDEDQYIAVDSIESTIKKACELGDVIEIDKQPGRGHGDLDLGAIPGFVERVLKGEPIRDDCAAG